MYDLTHIIDFDQFDTSDIVDRDDFFDVECVICHNRWGDHSGPDHLPAVCPHDAGTFIPNLPLKRPKVMLPDYLFEVE